MLYILNGTNYFSKESTISSITSKLGDDYNIKKYNISSTTKPEVAHTMLEDLLINLSMEGLFESEFCGIVSLPELPKKKKNSKSKKSSKHNGNLFLDLVNLASTYCSEGKQLIIHLPVLLSPAEKKEVSNICKNIYVEFIDLKYISKYKDIFNFCSTTLDELNINFTSLEDKETFISHLCNISECTTNKNGKLEDLTIFTNPSDIVYNQQIIYSSIVSLFLWSKNKQEPISFKDTQRILLAFQPKQNIYSSIEKIMNCSTKNEVAQAINSTFECLSKQEVLAILTTLKLCIWDYVKFTNGYSQTRNCKVITNGNFKFKDPLTLYHKVYNLREDVTLNKSSYKMDLILFLWEHIEN